MKQEITKKAIEWWVNSNNYGEKCELCVKYIKEAMDRPHSVYSLTDEEITDIYLKEQENKEVSNVSEINKCRFGWHDGSCCCNCKNQFKLMKHPTNKEFGKGSILEQCGWVCTVKFDSNEDREVIFFDNKHGMCEMYQPIKQLP